MSINVFMKILEIKIEQIEDYLDSLTKEEESIIEKIS